MLISERLPLVYLLAAIFGFLTYVIINDPVQKTIRNTIYKYHPNKNNIAVYSTLLILIMFYVFISIYDYLIR